MKKCPASFLIFSGRYFFSSKRRTGWERICLPTAMQLGTNYILQKIPAHHASVRSEQCHYYWVLESLSTSVTKKCLAHVRREVFELLKYWPYLRPLFTPVASFWIYFLWSFLIPFQSVVTIRTGSEPKEQYLLYSSGPAPWFISVFQFSVIWAVCVLFQNVRLSSVY